MIIGKNVETGENVRIDLDKFLETRAVITASSGQGKSWGIRKILQESFGKVQQIILDWEGEYSNLREAEAEHFALRTIKRLVKNG